jgi:hypothetical protein
VSSRLSVVGSGSTRLDRRRFPSRMELTYDAPQAHAYVGVDSGGPTVVRGVGSDGQAKDDDESDMSAAVARVLECSGGPRITLGRHYGVWRKPDSHKYGDIAPTRVDRTVPNESGAKSNSLRSFMRLLILVL